MHAVEYTSFENAEGILFFFIWYEVFVMNEVMENFVNHERTWFTKSMEGDDVRFRTVTDTWRIGYFYLDRVLNSML